ncbi:MAG TPA: NUDIX domain-containing protein [Candidatus Woesebacteria bacterium]|nr:NUDIX domain-containing protein [Candidatus Woesebacteria bacterium]HOY61366.1 NUDIX domain-containing protein [Candidatus Woesebacteria bacterium]HPR99440.1 NUDIX domain-containing protein [Candidatus Woesebacteria bacterium]
MIKKPETQDNLYFDERSAGGIVYRLIDNQIYWLIIKTLSKKKINQRGRKIRHTIYKFPKGHLNSGEVLKHAAIREVEEEGRIKAQIIDKIGSKDYIIWDEVQNKKIIKKVTFFLMEYVGESNLKYYDTETVIGREWYKLEDSLKKLAYDFERTLLKKANLKLKALLKSQK